MGTRALVRKLGRLEAARARDGGQVLEALREDPAGLLRSPANRMLLLGSRQADKSSVAAALALLQGGEYARGWPEYEWRSRPATPPRPFRQPRWDGGPLGGRTVLLYCEQGLGDTLQFIHYAPLVKARGGARWCWSVRGFWCRFCPRARVSTAWWRRGSRCRTSTCRFRL